MLGAEIIEASDSALELADAYQEHGILTPKFYHIVHFDKIRMFNAVSLEYGYKPLQIFSPREVTTYGRTEN